MFVLLNFSLKSYINRAGIHDIDNGLMGELTDVEQHLLHSQELLETRGKVCITRLGPKEGGGGF